MTSWKINKGHFSPIEKVTKYLRTYLKECFSVLVLRTRAVFYVFLWTMGCNIFCSNILTFMKIWSPIRTFVQTCTRPGVFCNTLFVILTCFHLTNFFGEERFSTQPSKNKLADEKNLVQSGKFSSATLFLQVKKFK